MNVFLVKTLITKKQKSSKLPNGKNNDRNFTKQSSLEALQEAYLGNLEDKKKDYEKKLKSIEKQIKQLKKVA